MRHLINIFIVFATLTFYTSSNTYAQQRTYDFDIDGEKYVLDEDKYNDLFGITFSKLVAKDIAKESAFQTWVETFDAFKVFSYKGRYKYTTYGDRVASANFEGDMPLYYLGWEKPGKISKANPNKSGSVASRMAILNHYLGREVVRLFTQKKILD